MYASQKNLLHGCRVPYFVVGTALVIEYAVFYVTSIWFEKFDKSWLLLFLGYIIITGIFTCNNHGKGVRVRYEQELSLMIKSFTANVVITVFFFAVFAEKYRVTTLFVKHLLLLMTCQILTIVILCAIAKNMSDKSYHKKRLYLYEDKNVNIEMVPNAEKCCISLVNEDMLLDRMKIADEVYLYDLPAESRNDCLKLCFKYGIPVFFSTKLSDVELRTAILAQDGESPSFYIGAYQIRGIAALVKRGFDVVLSFLLLFLFFPLFLIISLAIKIEDGGSVFYKQKRCTINMKEFWIIKFRSMYVNAEDETGIQIAGIKDSRITKVGLVLRKTKLDELPQLWNILKGDMSFVGPRPERPELIEETLERIPEFTFRNSVKAGLTGYAQVRGNYHTDFLDKLKWDFMYIENFSLMLDFKILLMTIPTIFRGSDEV